MLPRNEALAAVACGLHAIFRKLLPAPPETGAYVPGAQTMTTKPAGGFTLHVERVDGYEFRVVFDKDKLADLNVDEPPPLGRDAGPNPARLLSAAVASCLSASLVFCLSKAKVPVEHLETEVTTKLVRNERNRLRVGKLEVRLHPKLGQTSSDVEGCFDRFEDFCVVTESVRKGIEVDVTVERDESSIDHAEVRSARAAGQ